MEKKQRIVITGMGTLNAIAGNVPEFAKALHESVCGIEAVDLFDTAGCRCRNGGQVKGFNPHGYIPHPRFP